MVDLIALSKFNFTILDHIAHIISILNFTFLVLKLIFQLSQKMVWYILTHDISKCFDAFIHFTVHYTIVLLCESPSYIISDM